MLPRKRESSRYILTEHEIFFISVYFYASFSWLIWRNFGLLSFGDEAEDEEQELDTLTTKFKSKSAHDVGDPTLISKKIIEDNDEQSDDDTSSSSSGGDSDADVKRKKRKMNENSQKDNAQDKPKEEEKKVDLENIKSKLKKSTDDKKSAKTEVAPTEQDEKELKM